MSVVESGLHMEKKNVETKVELDKNVYKNSANQIEVQDDIDGKGQKWHIKMSEEDVNNFPYEKKKMKPKTKLIA